MLTNSVTIETVLVILNSMLEDSPTAITELFSTYSECNETLSRRTDIAVVNPYKDNDDRYAITPMTILNAMFGTVEHGPRRGWGHITLVKESGRIIRFERTPGAGSA